uniref:trypsin n=1 Tax=Denticeps clupeoides TaxID=299321 RepID=A0AAY4D9U7_9TELE
MRIAVDPAVAAVPALVSGGELGRSRIAPHAAGFLVSLQTPRGRHFCAGSLVHKYWVLTAAHCNPGAENIMIVAGDRSLGRFEGTEQYFKPQRLIPHPSYNQDTRNADIMLIRLRAPVVLNRFVSLAPLAPQDATLTAGLVCRASGWGHAGRHAPAVLHTARLPIVSTAECNSSDAFGGNVTAYMVCAGHRAGGRDACEGDSGGPLVCEGRVYGLVSWGGGCGGPRFPGVYAAVWRFRRWIDRTIYSTFTPCLKY